MNSNLFALNQEINTMFLSLVNAEKEARKTILENKELVLEGKKMIFEIKYFGTRPTNGYTLFIGMHGGGGCKKEINDQQFENHKNIYDFPDGIVWFTPRSPEDVWNMWHLSYIDKMFDFIIQSFIICDIIDANKVFLSGYSAGGDGVYKLAPRMADRLSGAIMCAGHPNSASIRSLRNISFSIQVGEHDSGYNRNKVAQEYAGLFAIEKTTDPNGYDNFVKIQENCEHWMKLHDFEGFQWLFPKIRTVYPSRIDWRQCNDVTKQSFYWLVLPPDQIKPGALVCAFYNGNCIWIESEAVKKVGIRLNDYIMNLNLPVCVYFNKKPAFNQIVQRSLEVAKASILERYDPYIVYTAEFYVNCL